MRKSLLAGAFAATVLLATGAAQATLIGGPLDGNSFGTASYTYVGSSTSAFTTPGTGELRLEMSLFGDSFGTSRTDQSSMTTIFTNNDAVGTTRAIDPGFSPFLLFFKSVGTRQLAGCDPSTGTDCASTLFSNGTTSGEVGGNNGGQANLAIYFAASTGAYTLFFDDGGPVGCVNASGAGVACGTSGSRPSDDNDYNDLVVTYRPNASSVPEPVSLALLGSGLFGLAVTRARRFRSKASL